MKGKYLLFVPQFHIVPIPDEDEIKTVSHSNPYIDDIKNWNFVLLQSRPTESLHIVLTKLLTGLIYLIWPGVSAVIARRLRFIWLIMC